MDTTQQATTLDAVLSRLATLEQENARQREENAQLRAEMASLRDNQPIVSTAIQHAGAARFTPEHNGKTSRRTWLKRAAGAAMASVAAGAMLQRDTDTAAAHHGTHADVNANTVHAHYVYAKGTGLSGESSVQDYAATYGINTNTTGGGYGVVGDAKGNGAGVLGRNAQGDGVRGVGFDGVRGMSSANGGFGVVAISSAGIGVAAQGKTGVRGTGTDANQFGVEGANGYGTGVKGQGKVGVEGVSTEEHHSSVWGHHIGTNGYGTVGDGAGTGAGALGRNPGTGPGVQGISTANKGDGVQGTGKVGVRGKSSIAGAAAVVGEHSGSGTTSGYGGQFTGARAQVRLVPAATAGRPTSGTHAKGELYMDSAATLYVCTVGGTPGTWRRLTTTTA